MGDSFSAVVMTPSLDDLDPILKRQVCGDCLAVLAYFALVSGRIASKPALTQALAAATRQVETPEFGRRVNWWDAKLSNIRWAFAACGLNGAEVHGVRLPQQSSKGRQGQPGTQQRIRRFAIELFTENISVCRALARNYLDSGQVLDGKIESALFGVVKNTAISTRRIEVCAEPSAGESYVPNDNEREEVFRQIRARRGQAAFRRALRAQYQDACAISGCEVLDLLEAAHIRPYRGLRDNHPSNGILLRADIHTLFDLEMFAIDPRSLIVHLRPDMPELRAHYHDIDGVRINSGIGNGPSVKALLERWHRFTSKHTSVSGA